MHIQTDRLAMQLTIRATLADESTHRPTDLPDDQMRASNKARGSDGFAMSGNEWGATKRDIARGFCRLRSGSWDVRRGDEDVGWSGGGLRDGAGH